MATYVSNRDSGGKTNEEGHYRFHVKVWSGNVLNGLTVEQASSPNMTVRVNSGDLKIDYSNYAYTAWNDAYSSVTIGTADTSNPRIDRIVAWIDRSMTFTASDTNNPGALKFMAVAGTPGAVPTKAADSVVNAAVGASNPWCELATVRVNASVTQITTSNITDTRTMVYTGQNVWSAWTPVLGGTGASIGNGTISGYYVRIGTTVHFTAKIIAGSTTSWSSNATTLSLPFVPDTTSFESRIPFGSVEYLDNSPASAYMGVLATNASNGVDIYIYNTASTYAQPANLNSTTPVPVTIGSNDILRMSGTYEVA